MYESQERVIILRRRATAALGDRRQKSNAIAEWLPEQCLK
jgi:hypothetical protein